MSTRVEQVQRAVEDYRRARQEIEEAYQRKDWYPTYSRDYQQEIDAAHRRLGAQIALTFGVVVMEAAATTYPRGETDARASTEGGADAE